MTESEMSNSDRMFSGHDAAASLLANAFRASSGWQGKISRADRDGRIVAILIAVLVATCFYFGNRSPAANFGGCRASPHFLQFESVNDVAMTVKKDSACGIWAPMATAFIDSMSIEVRPQHGRLQPRGVSGVIYTPDRGYVGKDAFALARQGTSATYKGISRTRIEVTVE
jgi:hypothetical protein